MTICGAHTNVGRVKSVNQDACCFAEAQTKAGHVMMAIVCDGVGGLSKGELASSTVVRRFNDWFNTQFPLFLEYNADDPDLNDLLRNVWDSLIQMSCEDVHRYSSNSDVMLGTTFTGIIVVGQRYLVGHVGDCRAYEVSSADVSQLTHDQTLVAQQVAAGQLTPEQAANHPKRNVILQSIGTSESVDPEFVIGDYRSDCVYVLCCDGFYNKLEAGELARVLSPDGMSSEADLQAACEQLVANVMERGERDNITVLAFSECAPGQDSAAQSAADRLSSESATAEDFEEDSETFVVQPEESPTIVVRGGEK